MNDVRLLPLFGNRAYQRFEDVVQGDDALRHAEFVADDAVADLLAAELFQRGVHLGLLVEEFCRTQYGCDVEILLADVREEVLEVYHAGQPVEVAAGGGVERVGFPADQLADLCGRHGGVYPCDFAAVRHDRTHLAVAEREYAADDLLFDDLHLSVFGSLLNDRLDLLLGDLALRIPYSEQAGDKLDAARKQPYEGRRHLGEHLHRPCDEYGDLFGAFHADALGHQLAEDDREVGYGDDDKYLGDRNGRAERHAQRCEHRAEAAGQRFARIDTRQDADQGDAYLNRGKESVRVLSQLEGFGGRLVALLGACRQVRAAR